MSKNKFLEKFFSAPAEVLEKTIETERAIEHAVEKRGPVKVIRKYWQTLGPGLTTGASDDDPAGIATYTQIGASKGLGLLWLSVFTFPLMGVIQEMCARIGLTTGVGLAKNIKRYYSKKILYFSTVLLLFANTFNIGADLGAMAESTKLLFPNLNFYFLVIAFALISLSFQIFIPYKTYAKYLKYLALFLFAYILAVFSIEMDLKEVVYNAVIPHFTLSKETILLVCAVLGTTISPYLFFWQTSQEVEEEILKGETTEKVRRSHNTEADMRKMRLDVWSGMFFSNLVMFFIITASNYALYANGVTNVNTAGEAALALRPFAGDMSYLLFTLGIIGTGLLAVPVLAGSASYALSEAFGWREGLNRRLKSASAFYGVIIVAMVFGIMLNFIGLNPIKTLIYSAVLNGVISPIILFMVVDISSREKIMGKFKNSPVSRTIGWLTVILMSVVSLLTLYYILFS